MFLDRSKKTNNKSQAWFGDFSFGIIIILIGLGIFFYLIFNEPPKISRTDERLIQSAMKISDILLTAGTPQNWTISDVIRIGITDNNHKINETKLAQFYQMDYERTKKLFGVYDNYFLEFRNRNNEIIEINSKDYYGKKITDPENIIKISRKVFYKDDIVQMNIYVWSKEKPR